MSRLQPVEVEHDLAPGVQLCGRWDPSDGGFIDLDSIELRGKPKQLAAYLAENNEQHEDWEAIDTCARMEGYASILEDVHKS